MLRCTVAIALGLFLVAGARAERPPETEEDASNIVIGTVAGVYVRDTRDQHDYVIKILVEKVEKGEGVAENDAVYAECFQRKRTAPRIPAPYGHSSVPREGERIRACVVRRGDSVEGIYKDWYKVVK